METGRKKRSITKEAAKASWILPFVTLFIMGLGNSIARSPHSQVNPLIIGALAIFLFIAGIIFGIVGLFGIKKNGVKACLVPSLIGLFLNISFLFLLLFIVYHGFTQIRNGG